MREESEHERKEMDRVNIVSMKKSPVDIKQLEVFFVYIILIMIIIIINMYSKSMIIIININNFYVLFYLV